MIEKNPNIRILDKKKKVKSPPELIDINEPPILSQDIENSFCCLCDSNLKEVKKNRGCASPFPENKKHCNKSGWGKVYKEMGLINT